MEETVSYRTCPLCEATCGLEIRDPRARGRRRSAATRTTSSAAASSVPKAYALKELDADPDRLRTPLVRQDGKLEPATWDEAFARDRQARLARSSREHGRDAVARLPRQPERAHARARLLRPGASCARSARGTSTRRAPSTRCRSRSRSGSCSARCSPFPVPDLDRTRLPADARRQPVRVERQPDDRARRARAARAPSAQRGGKLVVVDPRRTRTAEHATEHVTSSAPAPTRSSWSAIVHVLFAEKGSRSRARGGARRRPRGRARARALTSRRSASRRAAGSPQTSIRRLARELARPTACRRLRPHRHAARRSSARSRAGSSTS